MKKIRNKFKIPSEYFNSKSEYFKYLTGLSKVDKQKELDIILDYAVRYFNLGEISYITQERGDLPREEKYRLMPKREDFDFSGFREFGFDGIGFDYHDKQEALSRAIGEYFERFSFFVKNRKNIVKKSTLSELRDIYATKIPTDYNFFEMKFTKPFPENEEDNLLKIECVMAFDHIKKQSVLYPFASIFYGINLPIGDKRFYPPTSSGCAGGFTKEGALMSATLELVERDAFLLYWQTKTSPEVITQEGLPEDLKEVISYYKKYKFEIKLFNITSDLGIPVVMCHIRDVSREDWRGIVTAACNVDPEEAVRRALREACSAAALVIFDFRWDYPSDMYRQIDFHNRLSILQKKNEPEFDFFFNGEEITFKDFANSFKGQKKENFNLLVETLKSKLKEINVYSYFANEPMLKRIGFHAVRVVIPQLIPMYLHETERLKNPSRIEAFLKYKGKNIDMEINDFPHSFP